MRGTKLIWLSLFMFLGFATTGYCRANKELSAKNNPPVQTSTGKDWFTVDGRPYTPSVNELGRNLQAARQSYLDMNFKAAADQVRKAAGFLQEELGIANKNDKIRIESAIRGLDELAAQLDNGSVKSWDHLDLIFNKARQADMERRWEMVGLEQTIPTANPSYADLRLASQELMERRFKAAAAEINQVAELLKAEVARTSSQRQLELKDSWQALIDLANKIEQGGSIQPARVHPAFAMAQSYFADVHCALAQQDLEKQDTIGAGYEIQAAALNLAEGASWEGNGRDYENAVLSKDAVALGKKLSAGESMQTSVVDKEINALGHAALYLREEIQVLDQPLSAGNR
jgi:hypothetical protein